MAWSTMYKVNGFSLCFSGTGSIEDGVVIPRDADFENPEFVEALKLAIAAYPAVEAYMDVSEWLGTFKYNGSFYGSETTLIEHVKTLTTQRYITLPEGFVDQAYQLLDPTYRAQYNRELDEKKRLAPKKSRQKDGYVYLLRSERGAYKIGRTVDPENRAKTFGIQLPFEVEFICTIKTTDMFSLESELHGKYEAKRVNGEWFELDDADIEYIKGLVS